MSNLDNVMDFQSNLIDCFPKNKNPFKPNIIDYNPFFSL